MNGFFSFLLSRSFRTPKRLKQQSGKHGKKLDVLFSAISNLLMEDKPLPPVFFSFICQDAFDGRHNFIHIIRENLRKPYLLRVNHHM